MLIITLRKILFSFLLTLGLLLTYHNPLKAQLDSMNALSMPFGFLRVGDQNFVGTRIQPEFTFGRLGFGLDIPIFFNIETGELRKEEYQNGTAWFRFINYVRWGRKEIDPVFVRLGTLYRNYLGFGILMNNYTNATSFERRKVGITFDIRPMDLFGIEGTYSDFNGGNNLYAVRPYVRPLARTYLPILETLEFGVGFITDHDQNLFDSLGTVKSTRFVRDGMSALSVDAGITVINTDVVKLQGFTQYARLLKNDSLANFVNRAIADSAALGRPLTGPIADGYKAAGGFSIGANLKLDVIFDILNVDIRLERLFYGQHFQPQFFDAVYEIDKDKKIQSLANTEAITGTYARLTATLVNKFRIIGGIQLPDKVTDRTPAFLQLALEATEAIPNVIMQASYVKGNLANMADAFTLDDRSLLTARLAYRIKPFMVGVDYRWTYAKAVENGIERFEPRSFVMPFFGLYIPFGQN